MLYTGAGNDDQMPPQSVPFATLLRNHRRALGLTQAALAERAFLSLRGLQHLEAGDASPTAATLRALVSALGLSAEEGALLATAAAPTRRRLPGTGSPAAPAVASNHSAAPGSTASRLPAQLTALIGRDNERHALQQLLPKTRLLTLTGAGGCGKTRLALQLAEDVATSFEDVWLVELASVSGPDSVSRALAHSGGISEEPDRRLTFTCIDVLRPKRLLLILDNCEHLIDACAHMADELLRACPRLTILATSREPLCVEGEHPWRVPSLNVPVDDTWKWPQLENYGAVELFAQRAAAMQPGFALTEGNAPIVAQICRRLDGIPLALELAAARLRALDVYQLRDRLADQFSLLTLGTRTAPARHQTLRATLEWSYRLLSRDEREALACLAVFAGGMDLEAAESVCSGPTLRVAGVLDVLAHLVDRSLVLNETPTDGPVRYGLLEIVRQYALERLATTGDESGARARHAVHYVALAEQAVPELTSAPQIRWLDRLERDRENFRAALTWTVKSKNAELGCRLASGLLWWWIIRGHRREGLDWLATVLALRGSVESGWRMRALHAAGTLAWIQGFQLMARDFYAECLSISQRNADLAHTALAHDGLGRVALALGEVTQARAHEETSLAIQQDIDDHHASGYALFFLGSSARAEADLKAAGVRYLAALEEFRLAKDRFGQANALRALGDVERMQGDLVAAADLEQQSIALARSLGNREGIALALDVLGDVAMDAGNYATARSYFAEGVAHLRDLGARSRLADSLERFALLAAAEAQTERAACLAAAAATVRAESGVSAPVSRPRRQINPLLSPTSPVQARALAQGRSMSLIDAINYALETECSPAAI